MFADLRPVDAVMYLFYLVAPGARRRRSPTRTVWFVPLALSVVCAILWFIARDQLGAAFSVKPEARHLVTTGLYAKLRHPIYVFGTMAFLLVLLAMQGWPGLAIWVIIIPIQIVRARREQHVLAQAFGAEYQAYRASTWF